MDLPISAETVRTSEERENYAFVMNVSKLIGANRFSLASGHELRRASAEEIPVIKETLQSHMGFPMIMPWEVKLPTSGNVETLPEADWRYHVISFKGNNETLVEIEEACNLAPLEVKIGFVILSSPGQHGLIVHSGRLFQLLQGAVWNLVFSDVSASDIDAIRVLHGQLRQHDHRLVDVRRLARQLQDLEAVPIHSPLRFPGYFALFEGLLTHSPKQTDPYDSITRQLKKKVTLVDHRCEPHIDYSEFAGASTETIWTRMYEYRSSLAHGSAPTFDRDLQVLGSHGNALKLIKEAAKAVIRQALIEPQLIADLKDC